MSSSEFAFKKAETAFEPTLDATFESSGESSGEVASAASGPSLHAVEAVPLDPDAWQVIQILPRLDADALSEVMTQVHMILAEGSRRIALDLTQNQFFSLNAIQLCMGLARDLDGDEGRLALVGGSERTKKHFDVYGSLKQITVARSLTELVSGHSSGANAGVVIHPRFSRDSR